MIAHVAVFIGSLVLLAKGADYFVEYSARVAKRLGVSDFVIGLTITSIGTSVPELASSVSASMKNQPDLIIGNVLGSNIANIGLILGTAAIIRPFKTEQKMHDRDGFIMLASTLLFFGFVLDNRIAAWEAVVFCLLYVLYVLFLVSSDKSEREVQFRHFMRFVFDFEYVKPIVRAARNRGKRAGNLSSTPSRGSWFPMVRDMTVVVLSCLAIMFGARYLIDEAIWVATHLGIPEGIVGLTLIAVGTSLPELLVSISAVRKDRGGIVVGNVIGSNVANLLLIIGVSGLITDLHVSEISVVTTTPIMLFFSLGLMYIVKSDWEIKRSQGILAVLAYIIFILVAYLKGWG